MECQTIKPGVECSFWKRGACSFPSGKCNTIDERCDGCGHTMESEGGRYCKVYADPTSKWMLGTCNFATHIEAAAATESKAVNPLKASKRAAAGRKR